MSQNKPKLSDITRQNNSARVSKFASSMIPTPPIQSEDPNPEPADQTPIQPVAEVTTQTHTDSREEQGSSLLVEQTQSIPNPVDQTPVAKPIARQRSTSLALEDVLSPKAPEQEGFTKMTRIAEKHHELLRELSFKYRKNMNTILYNLLEVLDQTYQREKQNNA
jgi:hypothetical protein